MQGSIVRTITLDGVELQGLDFKGSGRAAQSVIIHLHGIWGNFYGNPFIDHFADFYPRHAYSFLSVNTRFHDDGSLTGRFETCLQDIRAWLDFAAKTGYRRVILQGHSLGALQEVYYMNSSEPQSSIKALILLSPFDNVAFYCTGDPDVRKQRVARVQDIASRDPNALIPKDLFDMWLLSAGTYLSFVGFDTNGDIFPFRNGSLAGTPLSKVKAPVFAAIGGKDFAAFPSPKAVTDQLHQLRGVETALIDGAPHNFAGCEPELLKRISKWLERV